MTNLISVTNNQAVPSTEYQASLMTACHSYRTSGYQLCVTISAAYALSDKKTHSDLNLYFLSVLTVEADMNANTVKTMLSDARKIALLINTCQGIDDAKAHLLTLGVTNVAQGVRLANASIVIGDSIGAMPIELRALVTKPSLDGITLATLDDFTKSCKELVKNLNG